MKRLNDNELAMVNGGREYSYDIEYEWENYPDVETVDETYNHAFPDIVLPIG